MQPQEFSPELSLSFSAPRALAYLSAAYRYFSHDGNVDGVVVSPTDDDLHPAL